MSRSFKSFVLFAMAVAVGSALAAAPAVRPVGQKVGTDKAGRSIYQAAVNGVKIGYKLLGQGSPLIMVPGTGATMEDWPPELLRGLAGKFQLILMDNRGMGHSTADDAPFSYELLAADVVSLLDALHVEKAHVLGYSLGSSITQVLLLQHSQRFAKAVIYATATDGSSVAALLTKATAGRPESVNPTVLRQIEATVQWRTPLEKLKAIPNQVMLVVGTADQVVGAESSKVIAAAIPGAWLVQFKNGSHALMRESPGEFTKIVLAFLELNETVEKK